MNRAMKQIHDEKWDEYYLNICKAVGLNSKCHSRKIGSVLVKDKIILATGYNGPARGIPECSERLNKDPVMIEELEKRKIKPSSILDGITTKKCPRQVMGFPSGQGLEWCCAAHSEKNCLLAAARAGVSTMGATIYIDAEISPCTQCFVGCINAGIKEIVVVKNNIYDPSLLWNMNNTNVIIREFEI